MTDDPILLAFHQWCRTTTGQTSKDLHHAEWAASRKAFLKVTGLGRLTEEHPVDKDTMNMLQSMYGPHGHAYCKMLMARSTDENN